MKTISQRDLRNDNAEVIRGVQQGETYTVTRRGVPVAVIGPVAREDLRVSRPARRRLTFRAIRRVRATEPTARALDDLRDE